MDFELTEEQKMLKDTVARFVDERIIPMAPQIDQEERFPEENFRAMAEMGLFGMSIPEEYGGSGTDFFSCVLVMEQIMRGCVSTGNTYGAHAILCTENIYRNGSEDQRRRYLPGLINGEKVGALAITEPEAGSDALSLRTRAEKRGDRYILNGTKMFITNGPLADVVVVYAKTDPEAGQKGISAFIVEKGFPGFSTGKTLRKMGVRGSPTGELIFDNCEVPVENLLGEENRGIRVMMSGLDRERIIYSIAPIGVAQGAFDLAFRYASERVQFGTPIISFQMIQDMLAQIAASIQAGRVLSYWAASMADSGKRVRLEASCAKLFCAQVGVEAVGKAVQIFGGYGFIREFPIERMYRDVKGIEFGAGTNQIQKLIIMGELMKKLRRS
ncbi:MAG: acyl-CoA dehydrogenase family protein [Deltaproteobacteria bacterium]|nr:acyl-CoA dehydrogenase family protein [Deltaproteobacteria bacterium]MBW2048238.1 acyl-CoA dehydrogenase family protein [Deltaproteobacteria bacterium]MBW2111356.1 acyl-CoA dehydrogenase family protein [Deltaproteobacteria bacterium]